jgi:hypothetical protein
MQLEEPQTEITIQKVHEEILVLNFEVTDNNKLIFISSHFLRGHAVA